MYVELLVDTSKPGVYYFPPCQGPKEPHILTGFDVRYFGRLIRWRGNILRLVGEYFAMDVHGVDVFRFDLCNFEFHAPRRLHSCVKRQYRHFVLFNKICSSTMKYCRLTISLTSASYQKLLSMYIAILSTISCRGYRSISSLQCFQTVCIVDEALLVHKRQFGCKKPPM